MVNAIAPSASPVSPAPGSAPSVLSLDIVPAGGTETAPNSPETVDFAALLGLVALGSEEPASARPMPPVDAATGKAGKRGGKDLPVALPVPLPVEPDAAAAVGASEPGTDDFVKTDAAPGVETAPALPALVAWLQLPVAPPQAPAQSKASPRPASPAAAAIVPPAPAVTRPDGEAKVSAPAAAKPADPTAQLPAAAVTMDPSVAEVPPAPGREAAEPRTAQVARLSAVATALPAPATATVLAARTPSAEAPAKANASAAPAPAEAPLPAPSAQPAAAAQTADHGADQAQSDGRPAPSDPQAASRAAATLLAADIAPAASAQAASATSPATPAPVTAPAPVATGPAAPHDLATLVERLVEARQAAAPQAVAATIAHGEFGRVGLSFQQDGAGLSVSMTSSDPGFAPAVQAAAASVPSGLMQDTGANAQRQDARADNGQPQAQQGQSAAAGNGQAQGQAQNARRADHPASTSGRTTPEPEPETADRHADGGIYA